MKNTFHAMGIAATIALGVAGNAGAQEIEAPVIKDGPHVIVVHRRNDNPHTGSDVAGCMIVSNNGRNVVPSVYAWHDAPGPGSWCGLSGRVDDILRNGQAVWQVQSVHASNGARAYVIKSQVNGRCLVRGHNGHASAPSLHLWTGLGGDAKYCGLRSADELIANGQAAWSFDTSSLGWGVMAHAAWTGNDDSPRLAFAAPPVFPNTNPHIGFASFSHDANPWVFVFWPTES